METKNIMKTGMLLIAVVMLSTFAFALVPDGPETLTQGPSSERQITASKMINTSGGLITRVNLSGMVQNPRWKAFVGNVTGTFTLDDATGSTIYDWSIATVTGRVYATRNSSTINWAGIGCATSGQIATEDINLAHTNPNDNVSKTFSVSDHPGFYVGAVSIAEDACRSINTYVNNASQSTVFDEVLLYDGSSTVYASILEQDATGYDGNTFDFQMIVPEIGTVGWTGSTAYYMYVELGND